MLASLDDVNARLAADLAAGLVPVKDILAAHGKTMEDLTRLSRDPQFGHMYREYVQKWNSPMSAKERVRMKAALAAEEGLAELYRIFADRNNAIPNRIDAYKKVVDLADFNPRNNIQETGSQFSVTINLGDSTVAVQAPTGKTLEHQADE